MTGIKVHLKINKVFINGRLKITTFIVFLKLKTIIHNYLHELQLESIRNIHRRRAVNSGYWPQSNNTRAGLDT